MYDLFLCVSLMVASVSCHVLLARLSDVSLAYFKGPSPPVRRVVHRGVVDTLGYKGHGSLATFVPPPHRPSMTNLPGLEEIRMNVNSRL